MPEEETDKVAETVAMMRMKKLPVFPSIVINIAKAFIVDTDYELLFREAAPGAGGGGGSSGRGRGRSCATGFTTSCSSTRRSRGRGISER